MWDWVGLGPILGVGMVSGWIGAHLIIQRCAACIIKYGMGGGVGILSCGVDYG